jgi:hypothetical protein
VTTETSGPSSLSNAGEDDENVYDYAKANDWKSADLKLAALKEAVKNVSTDVKSQSAMVMSFSPCREVVKEISIAQ